MSAHDPVAVAWAQLDAKHDAENAKWRAAPWKRPMGQPLQAPEGWRWWHRAQGHHTRSRFDLVCASYAWQCLECDLTVGTI